MPPMPSAEHNQHYSMDIVLQRVQALESRVGQLEWQLIRLHEALHALTAASATSSNLSSQQAVAIPLSWAQRATETAPNVTGLQHARRPAPAAPSTPVFALASATARRQITFNTPQLPPRPLPSHRTDPSIIPSVNATGNLIRLIDVAMKVLGPESHAQAGQLQPSSPDDWQLRIRFQLDPTGAPSISLIARISKRGPLPRFIDQMGHKTPFATFRLDFDLKDLSEASLELGGVADTLLLPPEIAQQLEDPNEVPTTLRYLAFTWRRCRMVGFGALETMPALSEDGTALLKALELLKARPNNAVQMWFLCTNTRKASVSSVDCIFRAIEKARGVMYKSIGAPEKTAESPLLDIAESGGIEGDHNLAAWVHASASSSEISTLEEEEHNGL